MTALTTQRASRGLPTPSNMADAMRLAEMLASSTMVPQSYRGKPGDILVAVQMGAELGLSPMQALQNIASINGRPSVWGDAAAALVKGHPAYEWMREGVSGEGDQRAGWCEIKRRGHNPERREFSVAQAKKASLWGKAGPWQQYPDRMLQLRARGFALRDVFPDALRGVITAEEAQDMPAEQPHVVGVVTPSAPALAAPEALPLIGPDGVLYDITARGDTPADMRWASAARKAVAKLEDRDALRGWRDAMAPHFAAVDAVAPELVEAIRQAVDARMAALTPAEDDTEQKEIEQ